MSRILLRDVHLTFRLLKRGSLGIKDALLSPFLRLVGASQPDPPPPVVNALRGVDMELSDGDRLGIVGHNGAGKSSLLRLLAGVYRPTKGERIVEGRITSLFELLLGFEPDATGCENIRYRGYLLKEPPERLEPKVKEIAAFSELTDAQLEMPVRYYSSGMLVRLAFSISTALEPEILLVDEVLAAGDLAFQEKARARMKALMKQARIMVLVSHSLDTLPQLCDRVLWLDQGQVRMTGTPETVIEAYREHMLAKGRAAA
jgi:ABC-type polysaccharide/polyol phosphate transport system ATPase subunit